MARLAHFPYLRPAPERVRVTSWQMQDPVEGAVPLPTILPDWDPATPLEPLIAVELDAAAVRADCHLPDRTPLRLALVWYSTGTGLRGAGRAVDIRSGGTQSHALSLLLEGSYLGDHLELTAQLLLAENVETEDPLAPQRAGSLLWQEEHVVRLEGSAARFPTETIDFTATPGFLSDAAWHLDWNPYDLNTLVMADLRLFINSANELVRQAVIGKADSDRDRVIQETIRFDVARTLIEGALDNEEFVGAPGAFSDGTVGAAVRRLIATYFPQEEFRDLANAYHQDRFRFETRLQAQLRLYSKA